MRKLSPLTIADRQRAEARHRAAQNTGNTIHWRLGVTQARKPVYHFSHIDAFKLHDALNGGIQAKVMPTGKHFKLPMVRHCTWG